MGLLAVNSTLTVQRKSAVLQQLLTTTPFSGSVWVQEKAMPIIRETEWPILPLNSDMSEGKAQYTVWFSLEEVRAAGYTPEPGDVFIATGFMRGTFMPIASPIDHAGDGMLPIAFMEIIVELVKP